MQSDIYEEFAEQVKAKRYEHAPFRIDSRKGEYQRYFTTTFGTSLVNIPVARDGTKITYKFFNRYQRRQKKFDDTVALSMILDLSTRKKYEKNKINKYLKGLKGKKIKLYYGKKVINNNGKETTSLFIQN